MPSFFYWGYYTASRMKPLVFIEGRRAKPSFGFFFLFENLGFQNGLGIF
jgi:hypothetical protein